MNLRELLSSLPEFARLELSAEKSGAEVTKLCIDSRQVDANSIFIAIRGSKVDSHQFLSEISAKSPMAIIVEDRTGIGAGYRGVVLVVKNTRETLDYLASRFSGDPSQKLLMFGVTGTNGKTSCTYLFEHIFNSLGFATGVIGTINHHLAAQVWPTEGTTPGPLELQSRLAEMRQAGAKAVAIEVTSHALVQHRADSVQFNTVLFTNLTRDHLDFHGDMKNYFAAKQRLFSDLLWKSQKVPQFAVINIDDAYGRQMRVAGFAGLLTYGQSKEAHFQFKITGGDFSATRFHLRTPFAEMEAVVPLCGLHSIYNVVGVLATATAMGMPLEQSLRVLQSFTGVPGRLQRVLLAKDFHVFVDYAHTPDALENVLRTLNEVRRNSLTKENSTSRIITVFGCGGDRDKGKRPEMANIAEQYSDVVVVTSDNPRTEDPMMVIADILAGFKLVKPFIEQDRRAAIALALNQARSGDVVLIAGKGHEDYQIIGTQKIHFSDIEAVKEIMA